MTKKPQNTRILDLEVSLPTLADVRTFWDQSPCLAEEELKQRNSQFEPELAFIMKNFPFQSALDVGCGTGFEPINYKLKGCSRVVGLDMSEASLARAKTRGNYGVEWKLGNAEALPFQDQEFEFGSAIGSLHHTPDTVKAISELERVTSKEIVVMVYGYEWLVRWRAEHNNAEPNYDNGCPIVKLYREEQLPRLFRKKTIAEMQPFKDGWAWYVRAVERG